MTVFKREKQLKLLKTCCLLKKNHVKRPKEKKKVLVNGHCQLVL